MNDRVQRIQAALQSALQPIRLEIIDNSADHAGHAGAQGGGHYTTIIVAEAFSGKTPVQRHQLVYRSLGELMNSDIHALSIQAYAPSEIS